ncbi:Methionine aminopeptidase [Mycena sanguinolenta]|uniref:Methionine aminopeptidase n=1 Tax=Mycena sanguinolenta TaxID=230812 RepID=A0A8H7D996_9AGAR|nr:Methionine aminopeptidase [Mycena sanguinolenta]
MSNLQQNRNSGFLFLWAGMLQVWMGESSNVSSSSSDFAQKNHKVLHNIAKLDPTAVNGQDGTYNPFPNYNFTGPIRPMDSEVGNAGGGDNLPRILNAEEIEKMRTVCRMSREILDIAAAAVRPGITTDELDEIVHNATIERNAYPSPLNYRNFPKSVCTSVNEVICHGIPDQRRLREGDIINLGKFPLPQRTVKSDQTIQMSVYTIKASTAM